MILIWLVFEANVTHTLIEFAVGDVKKVIVPGQIYTLFPDIVNMA